MSAQARSKDPATPGKVGGSVAAVAIATVLAAGGGGFFGYAVLAPPPSEGEAPAAAQSQAHAPGVEGRHGAPPPAKPKPSNAKFAVKELPPVVTNLARPATSWIRLQAAIVYDPKDVPHIDAMTAALMSDITAFLQTLELNAVEGPDGLRRLQEELAGRASTRFEKGLRDFIIETLVIQ